MADEKNPKAEEGLRDEDLADVSGGFDSTAGGPFHATSRPRPTVTPQTTAGTSGSAQLG